MIELAIAILTFAVVYVLVVWAKTAPEDTNPVSYRERSTQEYLGD